MKINVPTWLSGAGRLASLLASTAVALSIAGCGAPAESGDDQVAEAADAVVCGPPAKPPTPLGPLSSVPIPEPSSLYTVVKDKKAAIALGKAFFWDMQAGADGVVACASCHFHAGTDGRKTNQLNRGRLADPANAHFDVTASGGAGGPNYKLIKADFPFHRLADPNDRNSAVLFDSDDVVASQGITKMATNAAAVTPGVAVEACDVAPDPVFQVGGVNVRQVEPRNAPSVINAVFNFQNFWDGSANNLFNGVDPSGPRNPFALIRTVAADGSLVPTRLLLDNASLASQSVGPPGSALEMACAGRDMRALGRKMVALRPLANQVVDPNDSVLAPLRDPSGKGLVGTYAAMIKQAFLPLYWDSTQKVGTLSAMEWNFPLFWGLAIQLYEATLVADQTRYDAFMGGYSIALSSTEQQGLALFQGKAGCASCHSGPELTSAGVTTQLAAKAQGRLVDRINLADCSTSLVDLGFFNIGVRPTIEDRGRGGTDPVGGPWSLARQAKNNVFLDGLTVNPSTFTINPGTPVSAGERDGVEGAFKVPGLRNAQLTGPFFHSGGYGSLAQVIDFYNRGGDRRGPDGDDSSGPGVNGSNGTNAAPHMQPLGLTAAEKTALLSFLATLTDPRVMNEQAPFDHPQLFVADGHVGNTTSVVVGPNGKAIDNLIEIPAVGLGGRPAKGLPPLKGAF